MLRLKHLEVEYDADNDENDPVLQYLVVTFPHLEESLKIHQYRSMVIDHQRQEAPVASHTSPFVAYGFQPLIFIRLT